MKDMRSKFIAELKARAGDFFERDPHYKVWRETYDTDPFGFAQMEIYFNDIDKILILSAIFVIPKNRLRGLGAYAINLVCGIADKFNWKITAHIQPLCVDGERRPPLTAEKLRAFYDKFGFVRDRRRGLKDIIRHPKKW
jgi:hypothetical protein